MIPSSYTRPLNFILRHDAYGAGPRGVDWAWRGLELIDPPNALGSVGECPHPVIAKTPTFRGRYTFRRRDGRGLHRPALCIEAGR